MNQKPHFWHISLLLGIVSMLCFGCVTEKEQRARAQHRNLQERFEELEEKPRSSQSEAQGEIDPSKGLNAYLAFAANNSAALRAMFESWKVALEQVPQVRALPNPQLSFAHFIRRVETRVGPQRNKFGLTQMIPWPQKLSLNADVAFQNSEAVRKRFEDKRQEIFYRVSMAYYDLYFLHESIAVTEKTIALVRYYEVIARSRFRTAGGSHPNVIQAQLELGRLDDQLKSHKDRRTALTAKMNAVLNRPAKMEVPWPKSIIDEDLDIDESRFSERLKQSNLELLALEAELSREKLSIERAKKNYYPDFVVGVDYIDTGSALMSGVRDSSKDAFALGFGISLPIWVSSYSAGVRQAEARQRRIEAQRTASLRNLEALFQTTMYELRDADRKIDLYRDTLIPKAEQAQKSALKAFESSRGDFLSVLDVQRSLLEFQLNYVRARTDKARQQALIKRLVGSVVEDSND